MIRMERRGERYQRGNTLLLGGKQQSDRAAHAGSEDCSLSWSMTLDQSVSRPQIIDLATVGDVGEPAARLADVGEIEAQGENSLLGQLPGEIDQLLAILFRVHAVAQNDGAFGIFSN